jgi:hypothetical protein
MFPEQTVVWDYGHRKCWIGTPRPGTGGADAKPSPLR